MHSGKWVLNTCLYKEMPKHTPPLIIQEFPRISCQFHLSNLQHHEKISCSKRLYVHEKERSKSTRWQRQSQDFKMWCIIYGDKRGLVMTQPHLAPSPPLAGRLLLSASVVELPLLQLLVHRLPELHHALPTCHHAEENISFTPKIHVTSSHREPQAFTITVKSLSLGAKYLWLFLIWVSVFRGTSTQGMSDAR